MTSGSPGHHKQSQHEINAPLIANEPQKEHRLPGLKNLDESKTPSILGRDVIDHVVRVDDQPACAMTKHLFREEGLIVRASTAAIVHAAFQMPALPLSVPLTRKSTSMEFSRAAGEWLPSHRYGVGSRMLGIDGMGSNS